MNDAGAIGLAFMQALWAGDLDSCDAMLTDDALWYFQLGMPQAAREQGRIWPARDAMRAIVADLFDKFDPQGFTVAASRIIAEGNSVAIEYEANGRTAKGEIYQNFYVTTLTIDGDQICEVRPYNDTAHMLRLLQD
ncbi:MAG: nuclear transport factor 2 family protein [Sphingorhabdus sp.]